MDQERVGKKGYKRYRNRADEYLNDKDKATKLLDAAKEKAETKKGPLNDVWEKIQLFFAIFDDWIKGRYRVIPAKSITMIIVALVYFVIPIDLVSDFIPFLGFGDDAAVLVFVMKQINNDLEAYKKWKDECEIIDVTPDEDVAEEI